MEGNDYHRSGGFISGGGTDLRVLVLRFPGVLMSPMKVRWTQANGKSYREFSTPIGLTTLDANTAKALAELVGRAE
jgi:hypothetical protein